LAETFGKIQQSLLHDIPGVPATPQRITNKKPLEVPELGLKDYIPADILPPDCREYPMTQIAQLFEDWEFGDYVQVKGILVLIKYWKKLYQKGRPEIYSVKEDIGNSGL
jgi:hypothetical protein